MARKLDYRWHLRQVMADRGMFATTDLIEPLAARGIRLSSSQVYRLVVERPERLSLKILMALLDILDCSMTELIEPVALAGGRSRTAKAAGGGPRRVSASCGPSEPASPGPVSSHGDLFDLRPQRILRDLPGHQPPVVQGLPETAGTLRRLRPGRADPRRHPHQAAVRDLHPPRPILLARLPDLRAPSTQHPILHPLQPAATAAGLAGRSRR